MADATCDRNFYTERYQILTKLDALIEAFWAKLTVRERQAMEPTHMPIRELAHTRHSCTGLRLTRPTLWRWRGSPLPSALKQARPSRITIPTRGGPQAHHRLGKKQRPTTRPTTGKLPSRPRTLPISRKAPENQKGTPLTCIIKAGLHSDVRTSRPPKPVTLHLATPQQDWQVSLTSFPVLGIG
ncbi:Hypothetical predicted protein [Pelobates cultripes]|uniref:Uncharacterized protein n=1 Tax=Pelobates cultripes TaxID=61616 RepID=A0AAD1W5K0_PELCU|nr:Hypothetical predicted protein [Pelobates cultripes]